MRRISGALVVFYIHTNLRLRVVGRSHRRRANGGKPQGAETFKLLLVLYICLIIFPPPLPAHTNFTWRSYPNDSPLVTSQEGRGKGRTSGFYYGGILFSTTHARGGTCYQGATRKFWVKTITQGSQSVVSCFQQPAPPYVFG